MRARSVALVGGVFFLGLAAFTQGFLPMMEPESRTTNVTSVVRTDLGELKWIRFDATDYTPQQEQGRRVYIREGCWYCHSQFVRPVTGETVRWGPVAQAGESAFDRPHLFSTRRIGPDLSRVGLKFSDSWHLAHFWDPRMLTPDSIMPRYVQLFDSTQDATAQIVTDADGNQTLERTPLTERFFNFTNPQAKIQLTPSAEGLVFVPERGKYPIIFTPNDEYKGAQVTLAATTPDLDALVAYLQKLGTNRGNWRDVFEPQRVEMSEVSLPRSEEWIERGRLVYGRRCAGCHGVEGDGNGPAAAFMHTDRPRNFTLGFFKFRLTGSDSLPTDGDLMRTITRGVRGTAMPSWHELHEKDRMAVIQYVKFVLAADRSDPKEPYFYFVEERPKAPIFIGDPPPPSPELTKRGAEVWQQAKCWECHGKEGKGDGEKAAGLKDDAGFPIPPANLTQGLFKSGPAVTDIFRTMTNGLTGTPMPSYKASLPEEDRWALSYFVLSLSSFTDQLSGASLPISPADRMALNDPKVEAPTSQKAYALTEPASGAAYAGGAWAARHGVEMVAGPREEK